MKQKENDSYPPPLPVRHRIALPAWADRLSAQVARWPWWAIIIAVGLVAVFYAMATSNLYRDSLSWVTDSPQLTTNQFTKVLYTVQDEAGKTRQVDGVLTQETNDTVTVITQAEIRVTIPRTDMVKQTCEAPAPNGDCTVGQAVSVARRSISGALTLEDLGKYLLQTPQGETVEVRKFTVARTADNKLQEVRTPPQCTPDPEGNCQINLTLDPSKPENEIKGVLVESSIDQVVVQTQPPLTETIPKSSIVKQTNATPLQCALNNVSACNEGIFMTIGVTLVAYMTALVIGLTFGLMRVSSNKVLFNLATVYVEVVRGVPLLVILLFAYYVVGPQFRDYFPTYAPTIRTAIVVIGVLIVAYYLLTRWSRRRTDPLDLVQPIGVTLVLAVALILLVGYFGSHSNLGDEQRVILGLAFGYGAFTAELFRAGIQSIGKGQMEAARSLGMSYLEAMRYVILPQAFRVILPPLGNDFIAMLKDSSLIAFVSVHELTYQARLFASNRYQPFPAYITIGVLYLCMTLFLSFVVRVIERRTSLPR